MLPTSMTQINYTCMVTGVCFNYIQYILMLIYKWKKIPHVMPTCQVSLFFLPWGLDIISSSSGSHNMTVCLQSKRRDQGMSYYFYLRLPLFNTFFLTRHSTQWHSSKIPFTTLLSSPLISSYLIVHIHFSQYSCSISSMYFGFISTVPTLE